MSDSTTAPLEPTADIAAFNDKDARYVQSAAGRLRKPGDCVVIESQHQSLRDHYIKQILSIAFNRTPELSIQRCGKERDWMIARTNKTIELSGQNIKTTRMNLVREIWVLELSGTDDFELFKLGHTLASQFPAAGICLLVSCSQVFAEYPMFSRYSERLGIPMWRFGMPDDHSIRAFLNRESEHGAVNQARQLVSDLEIARSESQMQQRFDSPKKRSDDLTLHNPTRNEGVPVLQLKEKFNNPFKPVDSKMSVKSKVRPPNRFSNETSSKSTLSVKPAKNTGISVTAAPSETMVLMLCAIALSLVLTLGLVAALFEIPVYQMAKELVQTVSPSASFSGATGEDNSEGVSHPVEAGERQESVRPSADVSALKSGLIVPSNVQGSRPDLYPNRIDRQESDAIELLRTADFNEAHAAKALNLKQDKSVEFSPSVSALETSDSRDAVKDAIFAQFGAFSNRATAAKFWLQIQDVVPETFVAEKTNGMWGIVSGPYTSKERVPNNINQSSMKPYFISDSELVITM